ncbi:MULTISPECIES: hypothetical protein [Acidianus]|uniref:Uncharacterized protein n=1 Tax=Candidatus Acidianus copahuensis TaxID=1160895 RepID=A0A031LNX3_9CREN|nr:MULTISPECIES: hypothetical protein [Acidianus]EZQ04849.1 hypothetical protein CM19_07655 [Candidatus Acidianus copahuensis]NON62808.1 hypothetical protein [Acidianus sp. RZ1]
MKPVDMNSLINYVSLKILGGSDYLLDALEEYLVNGEGPAIVAHKYNISKHQLRGYAQRIIEKSGNEVRAKKVIPILKEMASGIKPVVIRDENGVYQCSLCETVVAREDSEEHVRKYHKDVLTLSIKNMMEKLEEIRAKRSKPVIFTSAS